MSTQRIRLITRGDDSGSCNSANRAILEAYQTGILRNTSVMVPGPAFESVAEVFAGQDGLCLGLHVTLNAEWDTIKWGPVLPVERVPALVDENGHFWATPAIARDKGADVDQMLAEIQAQLDLARARGLHIQYIDEHMGVSWPWPALRDGIHELAAREGLMDTRAFHGLPRTDVQGADPAENLALRLAETPPGTYVLVAHPGYDDAEMRQFQHVGLADGEVAKSREWERRLFTDPRVLEACKEFGVEPIRYVDAVPG